MNIKSKMKFKNVEIPNIYKLTRNQYKKILFVQK